MSRRSPVPLGLGTFVGDSHPVAVREHAAQPTRDSQHQQPDDGQAEGEATHRVATIGITDHRLDPEDDNDQRVQGHMGDRRDAARVREGMVSRSSTPKTTASNAPTMPITTSQNVPSVKVSGRSPPLEIRSKTRLATQAPIETVTRIGWKRQLAVLAGKLSAEPQAAKGNVATSPHHTMVLDLAADNDAPRTRGGDEDAANQERPEADVPRCAANTVVIDPHHAGRCSRDITGRSRR